MKKYLLLVALIAAGSWMHATKKTKFPAMYRFTHWLEEVLDQENPVKTTLTFSASGNYWTQTGSHTTTPWDAFKPTLKCASNKQLKHVLAVIAAKNTLYQENIWQWRPQLALLAQIEQDVKNAMKKPKK